MQNKKTNFLQNIYSEHLETINGVKLTRREVDIISFFICGRSAKKFASFFFISPKTVENHTHNIMLKLGCNSRESIIDFIEKSDKLPILRKYYTAIIAQAEFDKYLKDISKQKQEECPSCVITYWQEENSPNFLISHLEMSLKLSGITVSIKIRNPSQSLQEICRNNYVIYIVPRDWNEHSIDDEEISLFSEGKNCILFFHPERESPIPLFERFDEVDFLGHGDSKNYYLLVFEILKQLLPKLNLEKIISEFKTEYKIIEDVEPRRHQTTLEKNNIKNRKNILSYKIKNIFQNKKWYLILFLLIIGLSVIVLLELKGKGGVKTQDQDQTLHKSAIRSDLVVPIQSVRLDRPELIAQINDRFKGWSGIQTVALVGIEGAGKTTLARRYVSSQELPGIWEINAESRETLNESFEGLALALSKTEEDQKALTGILKIRLSTEREEKVVQFVKERLKSHPNWFLIYDNVEKFTDIQNHFPKDPSKWGQGRIILTTRDSNIENNKHINNVIRIGALNPDEKLNLFIKIMSNGGTLSFTTGQKEDTREFLVEIPPFPLDVSVAAYYLRATHIPYKNYLENISKFNKDFSSVQEKILQEAGDYTKTRYSIITLTLKHLIDVQDDFKNLLLFISLLDSQNIPRDLLVKYKGDMVVDNFIYHLKKHSLITYKTAEPYHLDSAFSIHRSIQAIMLSHLLKDLDKKDKNLIQFIAASLENYMREAIDKEDFAKMKTVYKHTEQLLNHSNLLSNSIRSSLSGELGCIYYYLCNYSKSKELIEISLSKKNEHSNKNYNKIAHFGVYLGNVYRRLGDFEKAKELFEHSLEIYKKLPEPHVGMARAYGYLGIVYESLGNFEKAKALLEESLRLHQKHTKNRIGLAWSLAHLGSVHRNLGNYEKAKELYEQSLTIYKTYSENYVGVAWVCGDLGSVYTQLKNYEKAKNYLEESLTIYSKHFSENHIYVAYALIHLGVFYREVGNYEKAKNLLKKGLVVIEATYGKEHVEIGSALKNLGITYVLEGKLEVAEDIINKAFDIFQKNKHPGKYEALEILGEIYIKNSMHASHKGEPTQTEYLKAQAISYYTQALEIGKMHFPTESPHFVRIKSKIKAISN